MKKQETKFKEKVLADLLGMGAWAEKIQQVGKRGTPDILACLRGHFIAIEMKKSDKDLASRLQVLKLRKIKKAYGKAFIVSPENWKQIKEEIITLTSVCV